MALKFGTDTVNSVNFVDGDNTYEVKQIVKDGTTVWCKPYTFTKSGEGSYSASISSTSEPTASTGDITSGDTIHYDDELTISYSKGTETSQTTTYNTTLTSLTAPVLTKVYTGSFGATAKNNNSISVTAKYYMKYGNTRTPSSGYRTKTIAANATGSLTGLTSQQNTTLYVFFEATKTATTTTHTRTYNATISGLDNVVSRDTYETSTMVTRTTTGNATANVNIDVTVVDSENSSTSSSTLSSSTASVVLGY
jgi:hypothetical protein